MDELKAQIKFEASQAARLSKEATIAFEARDWKQGKALMKEAVAASRNCQKLIEQLNQSTEAIAQSEKA
ncbi:hypothetical protein [Chroococcus sp. FPU101]|uniref:hypothetical protein n=1 Tax=Chroococcus sp. FPU101 TaxID=1974212 RepID=UPI001A8C2DE3|nr:hypothetical protein [Chroococcus sp. FPU101]GFE72242.1 hypothetical protein CFPU101_48520 [Chroococcus sp. FPU101]